MLLAPRLPVEGSIAPARAKRLMTVHSVTYARMTPGRGGCVAVTRGPAEPDDPSMRARPGTARMTGSASRVHESREDPSTAGARINHRAVRPPHDPCDVGGTTWVRDQWLHDVQAGVLSSRDTGRAEREERGRDSRSDEFLHEGLPCLVARSPGGARSASGPSRSGRARRRVNTHACPRLAAAP